MLLLMVGSLLTLESNSFANHSSATTKTEASSRKSLGDLRGHSAVKGTNNAHKSPFAKREQKQHKQSKGRNMINFSCPLNAIYNMLFLLLTILASNATQSSGQGSLVDVGGQLSNRILITPDSSNSNLVTKPPIESIVSRNEPAKSDTSAQFTSQAQGLRHSMAQVDGLGGLSAMVNETFGREIFDTHTVDNNDILAAAADDDDQDDTVETDLYLGQPNEPKSSQSIGQRRKLLVSQLANLIMNYEPEIIAQNMRSVPIRGQIIDQNEETIDNETNQTASTRNPNQQLELMSSKFDASFMEQFSNHKQVNNGQSMNSYQLRQKKKLEQLNQVPESLIMSKNEPIDGNIKDTANGYDFELASRDDNNKQSTNLITGSDLFLGVGDITEQNSDSASSVTCPPDYDDQSEPSGGSLTPEQQQQLFAESSNSQANNGNNSEMLSSLTNLDHQLQVNANNSQIIKHRPQIQCYQPGSRMIEIITKIITPILFSIIIVVGLVGNIIVMLVILEDRKTDRELTPTNLLILDLSLADLSFIIFCIPFTGWDYAVGHWVFGPLWCKFNQYLIVVCALSSIYTLVLMSIDRFLAIVHPIECMSYRTSKNMFYAIGIKWILILIIASPTIAMHGLVDSPLGPDQYNCRFLSDSYNPLHFQIIFFIASYLFPLVLIFCLYLSVLNKLWFGSKPRGHRESHKMLESKKRVTWLVAGIVVVFALCWCPIQIMLILMRLKTHRITATYVAIQVFSHILGYMNSCVNPIVYAFASETFTNSFKRSSLGRLCYMCFGLPPATSNHHNYHHTQDIERSTVIHRLNHNNNNKPTGIPIESDHRLSNAMNVTDGNDYARVAGASALNTSSTMVISSNSVNNIDNPGKVVSLSLEPRDRIRPSQIRASASNNKTQDLGKTNEQTSASQAGSKQLVARMDKSSHQIAHECEPCDP